MELSIAEIAIIMDTLAASLRMVDGGKVFGYTSETRENVWRHIMQQAAHQDVQLTIAGVELGVELDDESETAD